MNTTTTTTIDLQLADTLTAGAEALGLALSAGQHKKLLAYLTLMAKWNRTYNLTALRDPAQMMTHHLLDSLAAVPAFAEADNVLDVGAGGGLPGIVLAIWAAEARPGMKVSMVDTVHKKTAFLTQAKAELQLGNVSVHTARVEQLQVGQLFDVITSRAFAELNDFINWSNHLLQPGGRYIAMKGVMPQEEIARLPDGWKVEKTQALQVPGLDAERHLIFIERS
ncbi:16S rRNA (guanine(527)-N(7))-methyltransferase RsmG [Herbaspirillum lusitanum]|uniref:16S rRNA (guanine(527)-N(7))-methyltransferase RsmG n=1 Tax=Herbaspirillum lusitanum TaxID=213312 RepID=UPI002237260C|nr:16S rRNA (guanine(527)-N(7))-methyltransferase RsmG [Herbaspirillum lusitanum]MCW5301018.1 16S rRNA (guanine(527)-N(7))-methyltransferase RsmG [Herbaspirillum lusitanum]